MGTESKVQSSLRDYVKTKEREREWGERERNEDIVKMKKIILRKKELDQRQNMNAS